MIVFSIHQGWLQRFNYSKGSTQMVKLIGLVGTNSKKSTNRQLLQYIQKQYHCNVFADDTGLEVQALNNAPGVYSARYAGEHKSDVDNVQLLLKNMEGISRREAQFKTVIALCLEDVVYTFEGIAKGNISTTPIGTNGFGYDPIFIPENSDKTFAELTQDEKNRISHRGKAFGKLLDFLNQKIQ